MKYCSLLHKALSESDSTSSCGNWSCQLYVFDVVVHLSITDDDMNPCERTIRRVLEHWNPTLKTRGFEWRRETECLFSRDLSHIKIWSTWVVTCDSVNSTIRKRILLVAYVTTPASKWLDQRFDCGSDSPSLTVSSCMVTTSPQRLQVPRRAEIENCHLLLLLVNNWPALSIRCGFMTPYWACSLTREMHSWPDQPSLARPLASLDNKLPINRAYQSPLYSHFLHPLSCWCVWHRHTVDSSIVTAFAYLSRPQSLALAFVCHPPRLLITGNSH